MVVDADNTVIDAEAGKEGGATGLHSADVGRVAACQTETEPLLAPVHCHLEGGYTYLLLELLL